MAWLQKYPSGTLHLNFRFSGQKFKRSLKTKSESAANGRLQRLEENIRLVESGRLEIPADVTVFLLSDGRLHKKPQVNRSLTLTELFTRYLAALPDGSLEDTTLAGIRIHQRHLERRIGRQFAVLNLKRETLQTYDEALDHFQRTLARNRCRYRRDACISCSMDLILRHLPLGLVARASSLASIGQLVARFCHEGKGTFSGVGFQTV
jgi:hypothetical protein